MTTTRVTAWTVIDSPVGRLLLAGHRAGDGGDVLTGLWIADHDRAPAPAPDWQRDDEALSDARAQLAEYFAGERTTFDLAVELQGTPFQLEVWSVLQAIPFGEAISYGELARRVRRPAARRAVGGANGRNPVSIVVPCHRVIGADGSLTGYGWGNERKAWLLAHEGAVPAQTSLC